MNPFDACTKKKGYQTAFEAASAGALQELLWLVKLRTYQCPKCKKWHLTHRPESGSNQIGILKNL